MPINSNRKKTKTTFELKIIKKNFSFLIFNCFIFRIEFVVKELREYCTSILKIRNGILIARHILPLKCRLMNIWIFKYIRDHRISTSQTTLKHTKKSFLCTLHVVSVNKIFERSPKYFMWQFCLEGSNLPYLLNHK